MDRVLDHRLQDQLGHRPFKHVLGDIPFDDQALPEPELFDAQISVAQANFVEQLCDLQALAEAGTEQIGEILDRSEEHTSELQSLMRSSYAVFCLKKTKHTKQKSACYTCYSE